MAKDSNRGRDLPRAPQYVKQKHEPDENAEARQRQIARAKKIDKIKKDLAKVVSKRGYDSLFGAAKIQTEKAIEKDRKVVETALAHNVPVHSKLLAEFGLEVEVSPQVPDDDGKSPF
ncbi:hypothetical protein Z946_3807 [Sulfitobacter noctilucicola]|uniref:Putative flavoprotein YhiN n=1 Tax=Sulfitobacter noctilucicola TaxID=1342301 RepID=A0A7W6M9H6_9RHOB|nr:hypothetical protein [Sulfitobacter noctilucicola]KIN64913.1 hypothetical protein Z946_3807 [Sulfitobacter noctilucicola]MBB4173946.1 putative flavoprotein YhiN [Sulfitobacter noctilucicola]